MILIIGGQAQGKTDYACRTFFRKEQAELTDGEHCTMEELLKGKVVTHFHLFVKRYLEDEALLWAVAEALSRRQDVIIICNEVGNGIVPMDTKDRQWREMVGRLCCFLAQAAVRVDRVYMGLGTTLKGEAV